MTGSRTRFLALAAPVVAGLVLAIAALLAASGTSGRGSGVLPADVTGSAPVLPDVAESSALVLPSTTPGPAPIVEARTGSAPAPAPVRTSDGP